jgi:small subunit ribosomal protein S20
LGLRSFAGCRVRREGFEPRVSHKIGRINGMANTKSAKKAERQMIARTAVNKNRRSAVKTHVRNVEEAIASGNKDAAAAALKSAQPALVRTAQKGVMHTKTASRKVSRLAQRVKAMA